MRHQLSGSTQPALPSCFGQFCKCGFSSNIIDMNKRTDLLQNRIVAQCSPVNVRGLRASSQLLYELTCRCVENSNESPLWKHKVDYRQHETTETNNTTTEEDVFRRTKLFFVKLLQPWQDLLSLMQQLSSSPADLKRCSTAPPHGRGCQLGASLCWPGLQSAHDPSESQGTPAESCCCWDTAHTDLRRARENVG